MKKLFMKKDIAVIVAVLLVSALLFIPGLSGSNKLIADIYLNGEIIESIDLNSVEESYTLSPTDKTHITVRKGAICFSEAECRDKLCVNSGWLTAKGQTAACLPEKTVIVIKGNSEIDMMTY